MELRRNQKQQKIATAPDAKFANTAQGIIIV
jgi:hypothetical protein